MVGGLVHRGAFQLTVERALYGIINEGHACIKAAERMVTALLADMDVGLPAPDSAEPYLQVANGNTSNVPGIDVALAAAASVTQESTKGSTEMQNVDQKTWAAPRSKSWDTCGDGIQDSSGERTAAAVAAAAKMAPYVSEGWKPGDSCLGSCLRRVWETHRKSCKSYANRVAKLEGQNVALVARASEACRLQQEAEAQARAWEEKHRLLEQRIADVESRSRAELSLAQQANSEASSRVREAHSLFQGALERATPTLLDRVAAFAPRDTEKLALDLFLKLGVERDLYVHHLETKRMFEVFLLRFCATAWLHSVILNHRPELCLVCLTIPEGSPALLHACLSLLSGVSIYSLRSLFGLRIYCAQNQPRTYVSKVRKRKGFVQLHRDTGSIGWHTTHLGMYL